MKFLRLPISALLAVSILFAATPNSLARSSNDVRSIIRKIYAESNDRDAEDIFKILTEEILERLGMDVSSKKGKKLAKKVIKELKKNKAKLADGVDNDDLNKVLKDTIQKVEQKAAENRGNVTPSESSTQNG